MTARHLALALIGCVMWIVTPAAAQAGDVEIKLMDFGVGSAFRAGDPVIGVRLSVTSQLNEAVQAIVQMDMPDAVGDIAEYSRSVALTPGQPARVWLYAPLLPDTSASSVWLVRVSRDEDGQRGDELGSARISPRAVGAQEVPIAASMIGLIGNNPSMGLSHYAVSNSFGEPGAAMNELTRLIMSIAPADLPDRWYGLHPFEAVVWGNADPGELRSDTAEALREFIQRGGHLIIVLPEAGASWSGDNRLADLLPTRSPRREEGVPLSDLIPILSKSQYLPSTPTGEEIEFDLSLRVFKEISGDFDVIDNHYEPLIALEDGRVVAIQRTYGFGRLTMVGVDLTSTRLSSVGLPHADVFWNRVLGRRAEAPSAAEYSNIENADRLATNARTMDLGKGRLFAEQVSMSGQAGAGLSMAVLLFLVYFGLAGPFGFYLLKQYKLQKHSWLVFAGTAALFTALAWGGVKLKTGTTARIVHVTFLDHVARPADDPRPSEPQYQRASSWMTIFLPGYADARLAIQSEEREHDILIPWTPPGQPLTRFPNAARYEIDVARSPADYFAPSRSTATLWHAEWLGGLDPNWGSILYSDPNDPVRVPDGLDALRGTIRHTLPGTLTNVKVIWIKNGRGRPPRYQINNSVELPWTSGSGAVLNRGSMWGLEATPWLPGTPLILSELGRSTETPLTRNLNGLFYDPYKDRDFFTTGSIDSGDRRNFMDMLSMFHQLPAPRYLSSPAARGVTTRLVFHREVGRELDLSPWFSRPCLIIIGHLENAPLPIPLKVRERTPESDEGSLTIVRWIYPLPLDENEVPPPRRAESGSGSSQ